jgi:hypothetical protein
VGDGGILPGGGPPRHPHRFTRAYSGGPMPHSPQPTGVLIPRLTWVRATGRPARSLPRKEVIQPQLPLRLPCYDFVPVTSPTLDGSAPCGFGHRLQVLPASMT